MRVWQHVKMAGPEVRLGVDGRIFRSIINGHGCTSHSPWNELHYVEMNRKSLF